MYFLNDDYRFGDPSLSAVVDNIVNAREGDGTLDQPVELIHNSFVLNALSAAVPYTADAGAGYSIYYVQARRSDWYLRSTIGTAVTHPAHAKSLPSRWFPSNVHDSSLRRFYKIYSARWD